MLRMYNAKCRNGGKHELLQKGKLSSGFVGCDFAEEVASPGPGRIRNHSGEKEGKHGPFKSTEGTLTMRDFHGM